MSLYDSIVVTGGAGMLATAFGRLLAQRQLHARFLPRNACDVTDPSQVQAAFAQLRPSLCINCAAYTKVDQAEQEPQRAEAVNALAVQTLAGACRQHGTMLVHFSTDYVFDGTLRRPLRPDDPVGPQSAYGRSKLLGEQLLQREPPDRWLIIRTAWLYGPGGANFPAAILNAARAAKPLTVVNDQVGSPTFTFDLAAATLELIDCAAPSGIWHVVNHGQTTWYEFAAAILEEFDIRGASLSPTTSAEWKRIRPHSAIRPAYSVLDITPFQQLTGHRTRPWRLALHEYAGLS
ncbi:MAG TPA: dTDP-4-dehydrorhamnose reductase [Tepidisphaeraceae bacterium]|nr:dTDP-4-dehydrorhamnose reductase [Tepidisphaeraceae bacterium]